MGLEKVNIANSDFVKSTQTNDQSNPQQGTGATKSTMQEKQDNGRQNKEDRSPVTAKSNASPSSNSVEDKRKLFVGGLPTDITDPEFRDFFSQFGELYESVVMFDRDTRRSRGFGFVTFVNPDVSKSLLQIGNHGDGIGRLVMRGKTCEVKAAAPRGQAPTRGGKANRSNRGVGRNQHQAQSQVSSFRHNGQFPVMYQTDSYNMPYPQGFFSTIPGVPGYAPPVYHHTMPPPNHAQPQPQPQPHALPHGTIYPSVDHDLRDGVVAGAPYFFASPHAVPPPDHFTAPNAFSPTPQILPNYQQQGYAFVPYVPGHTESALQATEIALTTQSMEPSIQSIEEMNKNNEGVIESEKD